VRLDFLVALGLSAGFRVFGEDFGSFAGVTGLARFFWLSGGSELAASIFLFFAGGAEVEVLEVARFRGGAG
jgi:hypothetical protein